MDSSRFVVCDIEATGLHEDKEIIEIALITFQGGKIIETYETLVNPMIGVSTYIQGLTSISARQLTEAPKFYEIADSLWLRLEGAIFISHKTDFDYELLKKKFNELGRDLHLKTFCTFKAAQAEIPGLKSYSLDSLCSFFNIKIKDRHRALGDAHATLELFNILYQLKKKVYPQILFLPHHEKLIANIPSKSGLIYFKDQKGKVFQIETAFNMKLRTKELLQICPRNKELLMRAEYVESENTGSLLIAQIKRLNFYPYKPQWMICLKSNHLGEKNFSIQPFKKSGRGLWYFDNLTEAKKKIGFFKKEIAQDHFLYREGAKSKEEILRHNRKVDHLVKSSQFPTENILILGEGRYLGELSIILIRSGHVLGYGYSQSSEEQIIQNPENFIQKRFSKYLAVDQLTKRYIQELKNMRQKTDNWRSLAEH